MFLCKFLHRLIYIELNKQNILLYVYCYRTYCNCLYTLLYKSRYNLKVEIEKIGDIGIIDSTKIGNIFTPLLNNSLLLIFSILFLRKKGLDNLFRLSVCVEGILHICEYYIKALYFHYVLNVPLHIVHDLEY